jgi:hypothetical protein
VSYVYLEPFMSARRTYHFRDWVLDSGAFSAHQLGIPIDIQAYINKCKLLLAMDPLLSEVFALDVIGDWRASIKNTEEMWRQGVHAIPTYHPGEPESALKAIARDYPKIALGGVVGWPIKRKLKWLAYCFAKVWPKKIHGFGMSSEQMLMKFPFHSVDASNWEMAPCARGQWHKFGKMSVRGSRQNLRVEVLWFLDLEQRVRNRWAKEMKELESINHPDIRLAVSAPSSSYQSRYHAAFATP